MRVVSSANKRIKKPAKTFQRRNNRWRKKQCRDLRWFTWVSVSFQRIQQAAHDFDFVCATKNNKNNNIDKRKLRIPTRLHAIVMDYVHTHKRNDVFNRRTTKWKYIFFFYWIFSIVENRFLYRNRDIRQWNFICRWTTLCHHKQTNKIIK